MKIRLAPLALLLCALPLPAQNTRSNIVARCELTTANITPSGKESPTQGREFVVRVDNRSPHTIAIPRHPVFGWRVETQHKRDWRLKTEAGPVRQLHHGDPHIAASGSPDVGDLVRIPPGQSADFFTFLPGADAALHPARQSDTFRLTAYWAAPAALQKSNPELPPCAIAAEWTLTVQSARPANP